MSLTFCMFLVRRADDERAPGVGGDIYSLLSFRSQVVFSPGTSNALGCCLIFFVFSFALGWHKNKIKVYVSFVCVRPFFAASGL